MSRWASRVFLIIVAVVAILPGVVSAQALYLTGTVVAGGQSTTVASICVAMGGAEGDRLSTLLRSPVPRLADHPALIPARVLQSKLASTTGSDLVIVGGPLLYLPESITSAPQRSFYTALLQDIEGFLPSRSLQVEAWSPGGAQPALSSEGGTFAFQFPSGTDSLQALVANRFVGYKSENDATYRYLPLRIRVDALVPVAREAIAFGALLSGDDVTFRSEDVSALHGRVARIEGGPLRAKADIAKGDIIYSDMVGKIVAITAGKRIDIAFRRGDVQVIVQGSAYQSGAIGELISVGPATTGTRFRGRIISPTEVLVEQ